MPSVRRYDVYLAERITPVDLEDAYPSREEVALSCPFASSPKLISESHKTEFLRLAGVLVGVYVPLFLLRDNVRNGGQ